MSEPNNSILIKCIQDAVADTLKTQASTEAKIIASMNHDESHGKHQSDFEIMSVMGIKSSKYIGSLALAFPKPVFLALLQNMVGESHTEISDKNADACSELLNIIYASARKKINEAGFDFSPAIPSTICGKNIWFPSGQFTDFVKLDCETKYGKFILAFAIKQGK